MKITVKKLKGSSFVIEAEPHHTVAELKLKIETEMGPHKYPAARQVLVHDGKVLKDETTLEENQVDENGFVVVMLSPNKSSSAGETSAAAAAAAAPEAETSCTAAPPPPVEDSSTTAAAVPSLTPISVQPTPAAGRRRPNTIPLNLFPQDLRDRMIRPRRRINLNRLRISPNFQFFRTIARIYPQLWQIWYDVLRDHFPRTYRYIREHQAEFDALMNEEDSGIRVGNTNLTSDEMAAVMRLERLGFERALVMEVYLACDKDEQRAANYLLDHPHDNDD